MYYSQVFWTTALENGIVTFDRWSDQTHEFVLEAWNSSSIQNAHESMHIVWEQLIEKWLQTKFTLQQYDLNFVVDALQSKIIYLTGNNCKLTGHFMLIQYLRYIKTIIII